MVSTDDVIRSLLKHNGDNEKVSGVMIAIKYIKQGMVSESDVALYLDILGEDFLARMLVYDNNDAIMVNNAAESFLEVLLLFPVAVRALSASGLLIGVLLDKALSVENPSQQARDCLKYIGASSDVKGVSLTLLQRCLEKRDELRKKQHQAQKQQQQAPAPQTSHTLAHYCSLIAFEVASVYARGERLILPAELARALREHFVMTLYSAGASTSSSSFALNTVTDEEHDAAILALNACLRGFHPDWTLDAAEADGHSSPHDGAFATFLFSAVVGEAEILCARAALLIDPDTDADTGTDTDEGSHTRINASMTGEINNSGSDRGARGCRAVVTDVNRQLQHLEAHWSCTFHIIDRMLELILGGGGDHDDDDEEATGPWTVLSGRVLLGFRTSVARTLDICLGLRKEVDKSSVTVGAGAAEEKTTPHSVINRLLTRARETFLLIGEDDEAIALEAEKL